MSNHEGHEDHAWHRMRLPSTLPPETEKRDDRDDWLGNRSSSSAWSGFIERIYRRAMYIELGARHLVYEAEPLVKVYRGIEIRALRGLRVRRG